VVLPHPSATACQVARPLYMDQSGTPSPRGLLLPGFQRIGRLAIPGYSGPRSSSGDRDRVGLDLPFYGVWQTGHTARQSWEGRKKSQPRRNNSNSKDRWTAKCGPVRKGGEGYAVECRTNGGVFMKSTAVKRSIVVAGHKTSVSLEDAFWNRLDEIVIRERHMTLSELVAEIDAQRHGFSCLNSIAPNFPRHKYC